MMVFRRVSKGINLAAGSLMFVFRNVEVWALALVSLALAGAALVGLFYWVGVSMMDPKGHMFFMTNFMGILGLNTMSGLLLSSALAAPSIAFLFASVVYSVPRLSSKRKKFTIGNAVSHGFSKLLSLPLLFLSFVMAALEFRAMSLNRMLLGDSYYYVHLTTLLVVCAFFCFATIIYLSKNISLVDAIVGGVRVVLKRATEIVCGLVLLGVFFIPTLMLIARFSDYASCTYLCKVGHSIMNHQFIGGALPGFWVMLWFVSWIVFYIGINEMTK